MSTGEVAMSMQVMFMHIVAAYVGNMVIILTMCINVIGTTLEVSIYALHHDPLIWNEPEVSLVLYT